MKNLMTTLLTLTILMTASFALALDEAEIKASDMTPIEQADFLYRLQDPDTDQVKLAEEFKVKTEAATKAKKKAEDAEEFKSIYNGVIEFIKPIPTIDECVKRLPFYFNTASIETKFQHMSVDELTKRWSKMTGYKLDSGSNNDAVDVRLTKLTTSLKQNRAFDARITARLAKSNGQISRLEAELLDEAAVNQMVDKKLEPVYAALGTVSSELVATQNDLDDVKKVMDRFLPYVKTDDEFVDESAKLFERTKRAVERERERNNSTKSQ